MSLKVVSNRPPHVLGNVNSRPNTCSTLGLSTEKKKKKILANFLTFHGRVISHYGPLVKFVNITNAYQFY